MRINKDKLKNIIEANKRLEERVLNEKYKNIFPLNENTSNDPKKAKYVSDDKNDLITTLKSIKEPLIQQERGSMIRKKEVEAFQMALQLLGHPLPKHGVDGFFGPETANAFDSFLKANKIDVSKKINEEVSDFRPSGGITVGRGVDTSIDSNLQKLILKIQSEFGKPIKITSGYRDPEHNRRIGGAKRSAHLRHNAVDITFNKDKEDTLRFIEIASRLGAGGIGVYRPGVIHIDLEGRRSWGPNFSSSSIPKWALPTIDKHLRGELSNNVKVTSSGQYSSEIGTKDSPTTSSDNSSTSTSSMAIVTPEIISKMVELLKSRGIENNEIEKYTNVNKSEIGTTGDKKDISTNGYIISKNNDSNKFMVVFGGTPSASYGAKFMKNKFGDTKTANFIFSNWENTINDALSTLKEVYPDATINAVVGFSKGGLRAWPAVNGNYDFVGLIDPSIEGEGYKSVKNVDRSKNVILTYIPNRGWGTNSLNYAIEQLDDMRAIPVKGMGHSEMPTHFFNTFIK